MKTMRAYNDKDECGHIIGWQFVDDKEVPPSKSMMEGAFFEYEASGNKLRNGDTPQPVMMKSGKDMKAEYRKAQAYARYVKNMWFLMGIKIIAVGKRADKGKYRGHIDLIVEATRDIKFWNGIEWKAGYRCIIDLKYSGLLEDRWSKHGWAWTDEQKAYHGTQAIQYHYLVGLDFYFWVVSSKGTPDEEGIYPIPDMKMFHVPVTKERVTKHIEEGNRLMDQFKVQAELGFKAYPSLNRCKDCPLRATCKDAIEYPHPEEVDLTPSK